MSVYYINATSNSGSTFGTSGYFYPLYLTAAAANAADEAVLDSPSAVGASHTHTFIEAPGITFYMPDSSMNHAQSTAPSSATFNGEYYISYLSPISEDNILNIGEGVEEGDTFNSWRKKTNYIGKETIDNKALISTVDTTVTNIINTTGGANNIMTLTSSDNITGEKDFEGVVKFSNAITSGTAVQVGSTGKIFFAGNDFQFNEDIDLHTAGKELIASSIDIPTGLTTLGTQTYQWPSTPAVAGQALLYKTGNELEWGSPATTENSVEAFLIEDPNPIGTIHQWPLTSAPAKYILCDGRAVSRTTYSALFTEIGTTYGAGDGVNTFNVPNLKGRVPVGKTDGSGISDGTTTAAFATLGSTQFTADSATLSGEFKHTLLTTEMPSHTHEFYNQTGFGKQFIAFSRDDITPNPGSEGNNDTGYQYGSGENDRVFTIQDTGGGQSHNVVQPFIVLNYIIKAQASTIVQQNLTPSNGILINDAAAQTNLLQSGISNTIKMDVDSTNFEFSGNTLKLKDELTFPDTTPTASASSVLTTTTQGLAFPFTKYYEAEISAPNSGTSTWELTHGLGGKPTFTYVTYECIEADNGYEVGDEVPFNAPNNISNGHGPTVYFDATKIHFKTHGNVYITSHSSDTGQLATTFDHWKWRIKAWR